MPFPNLGDFDWDSAAARLSDVDWGSVPAWAGAASLLLAFRVFLRDRSNTERAQVDLIGTWATVEYNNVPLSADRYETTVDLYIRNASELPVEVVQTAYEVHTTWIGKAQVWPGLRPLAVYSGRETVPPQDTWRKQLNYTPASIANLAPEGAEMLTLFEGVRCVANWMLLIDNAGRRWDVRPSKGSRAKRARWYRRRKEYKYVRWDPNPPPR
jgi:hypothetical protein